MAGEKGWSGAARTLARNQTTVAAILGDESDPAAPQMGRGMLRRTHAERRFSMAAHADVARHRRDPGLDDL